MTAHGTTGHSNPFSTRYVRPGAIPYVFPPAASAEQLISELVRSGWRGQIIGPHGSGKSTLLAGLVEVLERSGHSSVIFGLHDGQRRMPGGWIERTVSASAKLVIVDGYEQLGWLSRCWLKFNCRRRGWGLLVTTHRDVGLPTIFRTSTSVELAHKLAQRLSKGYPEAIVREVVEQCFTESQGDMRETLFALYDRFESVARAGERGAVDP